MIRYIEQLKKEGDSTGGIITCIITNSISGLGEPVFDKLHADLGKAMLSINAAHGFEYGSGFAGVSMKGSEHNDPFQLKDGAVKTTTNNSGGIQGGISNGMDIYFRIAFKPVSTGSETDLRVIIPGAFTSTFFREVVRISPNPSIAFPKPSTTRPNNSNPTGTSTI